MRKEALIVAGVLLVAGFSVQAASASEKHVRKAERTSANVVDQWGFRNAYNGPYDYSYNYIPQGLQAVRNRNRQDFGFGGWDPSRPGDFDPSLRPSD